MPPLSGQRTRRHPFISNSATLLIVMSATSYLTTFVRERYFYEHQYGTALLDHVEVLLSVIAVFSATLGTLISFLWSSGRLTGRPLYAPALPIAAAGGAAAFWSPDCSLGIEIALAMGLYLIMSQRASAAGRLSFALAGAITAAGPTLLVWTWLGTTRSVDVLLGYLTGYVWQMGWAMLAGRGAVPHSASRIANPIWPLIYILAIQVDALIDQAILLGAGNGWAGAAALAYSFFAAATVIIVAPLGNQALASRFDLDNKRLLLLCITLACAFIAALPVILPLVIRGGRVSGATYTRLLDLSLLYGIAIPFSTYWQVHTRAAHRNQLYWRRLAGWASVLFLVHTVTLIPIVLLREWTLVPVATITGFATVALLWRAPHPLLHSHSAICK